MGTGLGLYGLSEMESRGLDPHEKGIIQADKFNFMNKIASGAAVANAFYEQEKFLSEENIVYHVCSKEEYEEYKKLKKEKEEAIRKFEAFRTHKLQRYEHAYQRSSDPHDTEKFPYPIMR